VLLKLFFLYLIFACVAILYLSAYFNLAVKLEWAFNGKNHNLQPWKYDLSMISPVAKKI